MRRLVPVALVLIAALGVGAAVVLDDATPSARASETLTAPAATVSTTTTVRDITFDALVPALDAVWSLSRRPGSSCLMVLSGTRVVYERNPDAAVMPASGLKVLTGLAALDELGPRTRLVTRVVATTPPYGGIVDGDLAIVGGGDPVLMTADWAARFDRQPRLRTPLEDLADRVVAAGVREVRGGIVVDDSRYDSERYVASWPARYHDANNTGPLSALFVNDGFAHGATVLRELLEARGVTVHGGAVAAPGPAVDVAAIESPAVAELVGAMLADSDNGTAELLTMELGRRSRGIGSTAAGTAAIVDSLAAHGLPTAGVTLTDGSGLDRGNRVTCRLLAAALTRAGSSSVLAAGLPVAGETGTLHDRFRNTPAVGRVRAKTGSLGGVATLAGFADAPEGTLTFVHVLNGIGGFGEARRVQDVLAVALVRH